MKYKITVNHKTFEVEIDNINARPIIAFVDGEQFTVMPGNAAQADLKKETEEVIHEAEKTSFSSNYSSSATFSPNPALSGNSLTAPLPGTIVEIFVKAGDKVEAGQVLLVIEAMKMKNSIRSVFSGTVNEVLVKAGQSVAHKQILVKFAELGEASWI